MFRIRRIFDDAQPIDQRQLAQIQAILGARFPELRNEDIESLPTKLRNPLVYKFRYLVLAADDQAGNVHGFALVSHEPVLRFFFLDYLATGKRLSGSGVGGALYQRLRDEARAHDVIGLYFECPPDDPADCETREIFKENVARLRFYERFGALPIEGTAYRTPISPGDRGMPFLMFDDLDSGRPLRRKAARAACRAILERKYDYLVSKDYVDHVVSSFSDDPVTMRAPRYAHRTQPPKPTPYERTARERIVLVVNDKHQIHHVRDRGYVEAPVRIGAILRELEPTGLFRKVPPREHSESTLSTVHDESFMKYVKRACRNVPEGKSLYPYVFPIRNAARPPKELAVRAGYYCIDTFTPLNQNAFLAAKRAVDCAMTAASHLLAGERIAYALIRPPGHHAERRTFGGFCYFNNNAIAAQHLSQHGRVAILDIDYHHGNGQQEIFYDRPDVLTVSIHGHPSFAYPYFSGFDDERGEADGAGANLNIPLRELVEGDRYRKALASALRAIERFRPRFLVVALGLDTAKADPTGTWSLRAPDFEANGAMIGALRLPTLVIQEGGYRTRTLGKNARRFFEGLVRGAFGPQDVPRRTSDPTATRGGRRGRIHTDQT